MYSDHCVIYHFKVLYHPMFPLGLTTSRIGIFQGVWQGNKRPCLKNLPMGSCKPFFASNFIGYCLLLSKAVSGLRLILTGWAFMALPGILLSSTEGQLLVECGGNNTLLFWLVCLRVKIRSYLGPPNHSVAPRELRRSQPRNGVGHSSTTEKPCEINSCSYWQVRDPSG